MVSLRGFAQFIKKQTNNRPNNYTVGDIASCHFPEDCLPKMVSSVVASTTRSPTVAEVNYAASQQLHAVCYDPTFWDRLVTALDQDETWIAAAKQDLRDPQVRAWAHSIDPRTTHCALGSTLYSEEDAADHSVARFLHPATKIIQAMAHCKGVEEPSQPTMLITSVSATKSQSTPDRVFRLFDLIKAINEIKAIIEFKTPNSLDEEDFAVLFRCFQRMQAELHQIFPIPYVWMDDQRSLTQKLDKILCQLWCEMQSFDVSYGLLSSFLSNLIVRRENVRGYNCLYFSDFLGAQQLTLKHIVALEAAALEWIVIPPPPQLSQEAKNLMASYSDEDRLRRLLLGGEWTYGWDARFSNMIRLRNALRVAAANPINNAGTMNTPTHPSKPPAVEEDDDETPRAIRARPVGWSPDQREEEESGRLSSLD
ncbi:hypothetical protein CPB85DRAFT_1432056 [Mucidula mucida]|nr:hypothetical protein CPB85DRAFT_1432056 [Mucidula mucida]